MVLYLLWTLINIGYILENKWGFTLHHITPAVQSGHLNLMIFVLCVNTVSLWASSGIAHTQTWLHPVSLVADGTHLCWNHYAACCTSLWSLMFVWLMLTSRVHGYHTACDLCFWPLLWSGPCWQLARGSADRKVPKHWTEKNNHNWPPPTCVDIVKHCRESVTGYEHLGHCYYHILSTW